MDEQHKVEPCYVKRSGYRSSVLCVVLLIQLPAKFSLPPFIFTVCTNMAALRDLYKECQDVARTLSLQFGKVKFNKSLCRLLTDKYAASLEYLDRNIFCEGDSIDLPCKTALVELRRIMLCGQQLVTQWTKKDWWTSVMSSSDSASLENKVILHLREFLACVDVFVQMKTNIMYRPVLVSLESGCTT